MGSKEKIKNIEFLRFGLAVSIVNYHIYHAGKSCFGAVFKEIPAVHKLLISSYGGFFAVDMFFIFAGFFLFLNFNPETKVIDFVKKKIIRLYPLVALFAILDVIFSIFIYKIPHYLPHYEILRILLIDNIGLNIKHSGITWYVSALFWGLLFYFYLAKILDKKYFNLIVALLIVFCYSYLIHAYNGYLNNAHTISWCYVFNGGVMRAVAGIGCGYFISEFYKNIKSYTPSGIKTLFYTLCEGFLFYFCFNNLLFHKLNSKENFIIILGLIGLFVLFLLKRGIISKLFDNNFSTFLGKYSYSIFIIHTFVLTLIRQKICLNNTDFVTTHAILIITLSIILSIIAGVLTYHIVEKPAEKYLKKLIRAQKIS